MTCEAGKLHKNERRASGRKVPQAKERRNTRAEAEATTSAPSPGPQLLANVERGRMIVSYKALSLRLDEISSLADKLPTNRIKVEASTL